LLVLALCPGCADKASSPGDVVVVVEDAGTSGHPASGTDFLLIAEDPNVVINEVRFGFLGRDSRGELAEFRRQIGKNPVGRGAADESGSLIFRNVPPGRYWVINLDPVRIRGERIIWAHPVSLGETAVPRVVRLERSNAALLVAD